MKWKMKVYLLSAFAIGVATLAMARVMDGMKDDNRPSREELMAEQEVVEIGAGMSTNTLFECMFCQDFDVNAKISITGRIVSVSSFLPRHGMERGIHMKVQTDTDILPVHVGPAWFLNSQALKLNPNDHVTVIGFKIAWNNAPVIMASEIVKEGVKVKLRDETGAPVWSHRRMHMHDIPRF